VLRKRFWRNPAVGLAMFVTSGIAGFLYNLITIVKYECDGPKPQYMSYMNRIDIQLMSYVIPIVDRSYRFVIISGGSACRAFMVRDLYATDWLICVIGLIFALPSLLAVRQVTIDAAGGKLKINVNDKARQGLRMWFVIIIIGAFVCLDEAWFGSFSSARSIYFNNVALNDTDLYRVCIFSPLCLLFASLSLIFSGVVIAR
jgi:hypothetical protein